MTPLLQVRNLTKQYENDEVITPVLFGVSFDIMPGEFVSIMGPSGSGKSTLMQILGFLDKHTTGDYIFKGRNTNDLIDDEMAEVRNSEIGFIFQSFNLLPRTSVFENVKLPLIYSQKKNNFSLAVDTAVGAVGLEHRKDYLSNQLSGGEKQRVAIARALVNNPDLIFADEPTGNLDSKNGAQIMKILQELNKQGKTIILVTHEQATAEHAERIIKIKDGLIMSDEKVVNRIFTDGGNLRK